MRNIEELNINEGGKPVSRKPPTESQLIAFERHFAVKLPSEYVSLLKHSNGGHPEIDSFPVPALGPGLYGVNRFYFLDDDCNNLEGLWRATEEWQSVIPGKTVPFANDPSGNQLVLCYQSANPSVKLYLHDSGLALIDVAPSFVAFTDLLCKDPEMI